MSALPVDARVGARIKALRLERGVSVESVARRLAISLKGYLEREAGVSPFSASDILILCDIFNVRAEDVFEDLRPDGAKPSSRPN
ncbi:MAG: helix-turn-helix transcriptional regulator [Rhodoblastus sp.]|nr:MAG: helix-turn-helix transcriptional regulator [Rhodoblastus sp.]